MKNEIKDQKNVKNDFFANVKNFTKKYKKSLVVGIFLLAVFLLPVAAFAGVRISIALTQAKNAQIDSAIMNNDYETWSVLVSDENIKSKVTEQNFSSFTNAYRLLKQGNVEDANPIKISLGLKKSFFQSSSKSQTIKNAIQSNDYKAWRSLVGASTMASVNAENFADYVNAYTAASDGDIAAANGFLRKLDLKTDDFSSGR
ncbi:MAG: hypothetical protein ACOYL8_00745 [Patescibacteria group bacterium]